MQEGLWLASPRLSPKEKMKEDQASSRSPEAPKYQGSLAQACPESRHTRPGYTPYQRLEDLQGPWVQTPFSRQDLSQTQDPTGKFSDDPDKYTEGFHKLIPTFDLARRAAPL